MIDTVPAVLLWLVTACRAPAAWRDRDKRALWAAFFFLSVVMTIRPVKVASSVDTLVHIPNFAALIKHLSGLGATHAVLVFVHTMSEQSTAGLKARRSHVAVPIAAGFIISALFFATPQRREATDLLTEYAADGRIATYGVLWTTMLGMALISATALCWRWGRQPDTGLLGHGLRLTGIGTTIGMAYAVHRIAMVTLRYLGYAPISPRTDQGISSLLLGSALIFIMFGSTLPALPRLLRWWRDYRDLLRLYPLWHSLTEVVPSVRLDPPRGITAERLTLRHTHQRLYRRNIEIRDAILDLRNRTSGALRDQAIAHVTSRGLTGAYADIAAEACWLAAVKDSRFRGKPTRGEHHPPASGGRDLASEIPALKALAAAYHSDLASDFTAQCTSARPPETNA
ncbi:MAB_1171c family putative transporter [Streptomyces sp. RTd22]|uniref:MAB_1171c family putative transporter n=1 Tax=Streptomyces sp. RTd22 TaxID=1841249 RepID=UPI0007C47478|nr:MAB_1171c family putative transporter [Streptomyces sp. RTd22]